MMEDNIKIWLHPSSQAITKREKVTDAPPTHHRRIADIPPTQPNINLQNSCRRVGRQSANALADASVESDSLPYP